VIRFEIKKGIRQLLTSQFRLSRLNIFLFDFRQAFTFAQYILKKRLHYVKNPTAKAKLVHLAFNTALIISYARPFHKSNESDGLPKAWLSTDEVTLNEAEDVIHTKVMIMRDQAFAHSDALSHEINGFEYGGSQVKLYKSAFDPLTIEDTRLLRQMISKWINRLESPRISAK